MDEFRLWWLEEMIDEKMLADEMKMVNPYQSGTPVALQVHSGPPLPEQWKPRRARASVPGAEDPSE